MKKFIFAGAVIVFAVAHVIRPDIADKSLLVLMLLAVSPWIIPFLAGHLRSAEMFGAKVEFLEQTVKKQAEQIDALFVASMGSKPFLQLEKFGPDRKFGRFELNRAFESELSHLENLRYISYKGDIKGLDDLRDVRKRDELSDYIELTKSGETFLKLRKEMLNAAVKPP